MNQAGDECGYVDLHKVQQILGVTRLAPVVRESEGEVITVADPGFPEERGVSTQTELYHIVWPNFRKICMKIRKIGSLHI